MILYAYNCYLTGLFVIECSPRGVCFQFYEKQTKLVSTVYLGKPNLISPPIQFDVFGKLVQGWFKTNLNQF